MEVIKYPSREEWASLAQRPALDVTALFDTVRTVLDEVRKGGDAAVIRYEEKFDKIDPATFKRLQVSEQELAEAKELVPEELKQAIRQAKNNIEIFHASQRFMGKKVETTPGVTCWQKAVAIEKVGLYIPGGTAPLFSTVLMLAVPARIAGCKEIVLCTDNDVAGEKCAARIIEDKKDSYRLLRQRVPEGKDWNEYLLNHVPERCPNEMQR